MPSAAGGNAVGDLLDSYEILLRTNALLSALILNIEQDFFLRRWLRGLVNTINGG